MAYRVKISPRAKSDLHSIYIWIRAAQSDHALEWYLGLKAALGDLKVNPERCPVTAESKDYRHLLYGKPPHVYRVIFRINEKPRLVEIVHIRHGARQPLTLTDLN